MGDNIYILNELQIKLLSFAVLVVALVLHEVGHAAVALWNGDPTAKRAGRISLNPLVHFDPIGLLMILFLPIGFAKPVPVNPINFNNYKKGIITTSLAGVVVNLIIAFFFSAFYVLLLERFYEFCLTTIVGAILLGFAELFCVINISLLVFNLLPIYPLDGYRVVEAVAKRDNPYCRFMRTGRNGIIVLMALILVSVVVDYAAPYMPFLVYFDILGFWLSEVMMLIWTPMLWFWNLFF